MRKYQKDQWKTLIMLKYFVKIKHEKILKRHMVDLVYKTDKIRKHTDRIQSPC